MKKTRSWMAGAILIIAASAAAQDPGVSQDPGRSALSAGKPDLTLADEGGDPGADRMFEQAKDLMQRMQENMRKAEKQRDQAKKQKDLVRLNCLNEKITQGQGQVHDAEQAMAALSEAVVRNGTAARRHEYARIRIYAQKVQVLQAEADNCAGEEAGYVGPAQIEVDVDPTIPQGDPTDPGLPKPNFASPPAGVEQAVPDSPSANEMMII